MSHSIFKLYVLNSDFGEVCSPYNSLRLHKINIRRALKPNDSTNTSCHKIFSIKLIWETICNALVTVGTVLIFIYRFFSIQLLYFLYLLYSVL